MTNELKIERVFAADPETVFAFVTTTEHLLKWWGPEGVNIKDHALDLSVPGAWWSTMVNADGNTFKVSGEVTRTEPPKSVEFTWAWHDDKDVRGHESNVRFDIESNSGGGARFVLTQSGLSDEESRLNHNEGWTSSLRKLERLAG
ncbi:MAG: SRPBCC domain-containing protein [Rhizobiaceae bacterium]|nr:SRPBCC domain-containing protein [Rhizobiaceae bacterium]